MDEVTEKNLNPSDPYDKSPDLATNDSLESDEKTKNVQKRLMPVKELIESERTYVASLRFIAEKYIPIVYNSQQTSNIDSLSNTPIFTVPEDLVSKWRIIWGNWIQLFEWHQNFLDRLDTTLEGFENDPNKIDLIPKLFIDSKPRLRNNYSKYCENHRRAALIAEQYREFFEEVRVRIADKQDVVSHLMKPVQRIMRYQLPMEGIVKLTERAELPSLLLWTKALAIMKEIPTDAQFILEAARIDGFPCSIISLGKVRIRDDLLVSCLDPTEFSTFCSQFQAHIDSLPAQNQSESQSTSDSILRNGEITVVSQISELVKFFERRVFLFDQALLITEEIKPKSKSAFAQSSFQFVGSVNVNKMRFDRSILRGNNTGDLCFVIHDISPGREVFYVVDPGNKRRQQAWITQLIDLQNMQNELLLALQDPKKFASGSTNGSATMMPTFSVPLSHSGSSDHMRVKSDSLVAMPPIQSSAHSGGSEQTSSNSSMSKTPQFQTDFSGSNSNKDSRLRLLSFTNKKKQSRSQTTSFGPATNAIGYSNSSSSSNSQLQSPLNTIDSANFSKATEATDCASESFNNQSIDSTLPPSAVGLVAKKKSSKNFFNLFSSGSKSKKNSSIASGQE